MLKATLVSSLALQALVIAGQPSRQTPPPLQTQQAQPPLPKGAMPILGRPTTKDDPVPILDFEEYFVGNWKFEWNVPDSVLGPGGQITGTEVYKPGVEGKFFESEIDAVGPQGPFKVKSSIIYLVSNKVVSRYEQDSRGFSYLKSGSVGGDLGGYFNIYYESGPFTYNGKVIRMKTSTRLLSPVSYRVMAQISVDGAPFTNFGNPWWSKSVPGVTTPK
ncbi:MAG: hypothetical protein HYZ58_00855 [Acidobacteria bacterium]|nr:hypothetical protein [Acidobacteriota bacterium]